MYFVVHEILTMRGKYSLHTSEIPRCPVEGKSRGSFPRILFTVAVEEDHMRWISDLALISRIGLSHLNKVFFLNRTIAYFWLQCTWRYFVDKIDKKISRSCDGKVSNCRLKFDIPQVCT